MKIRIRKFSASWCGPCKAMHPEWEKLKKAHADWTFEEIDIDQNSELADKENVMSVPTLIISIEGKGDFRIVGYQTKAQIEKFIQEKTK